MVCGMYQIHASTHRTACVAKVHPRQHGSQRLVTKRTKGQRSRYASPTAFRKIEKIGRQLGRLRHSSHQFAGVGTNPVYPTLLHTSRQYAYTKSNLHQTLFLNPNRTNRIRLRFTVRRSATDRFFPCALSGQILLFKPSRNTQKTRRIRGLRREERTSASRLTALVCPRNFARRRIADTWILRGETPGYLTSSQMLQVNCRPMCDSKLPDANPVPSKE